MGKWIGRIIYAILLIFVTFFVMSGANDARSNAYLAENMSNNWDDEEEFFVGINTLLNLDYITEEPIIPAYVDDTGKHQLTFQIYGIGYTDTDGNHLDGVMLFVNDLLIYEEDETSGLYKKVENPYVRLTIYTDEPIEDSADFVSYSGFEGQNFSAGFLFDQESVEIAYDLTMDDGSLATITRIDIDYSNGSSDGTDLIYKPESLMIISDTLVDDPVFEDSIKISDFSYDAADYRLQDQLTTWPVTDAEADALNLFIERDDITAYNWDMIRVYLIYGLFVIIVTYLLFFHKKTMQYIYAKRAAKKGNQDSDGNKLNPDVIGPIFKDEPVEEDGK